MPQNTVMCIMLHCITYAVVDYIAGDRGLQHNRDIPTYLHA